MNKSKFLKRSLAALLAILLVAAMIPMSALAADDDTTTEPAAPAYTVVVNNREAAFEDGGFKATVYDTYILSVAISGKPKDVTVDLVTKNGNVVPLTSNTAVDLKQEATLVDEDKGLYNITLRETKGTEKKEYILAVTATNSVPVDNVDIKAVRAAEGDIIETVYGTDDITLTLPLGNKKGDIRNLTFIPANYNATASYNSTNETVTVTAADGSWKTYKVIFKNETGFTSFKVGDSVGEISEDGLTINVTVPKGTNITKITPTWETSETGNVMKVYSNGTNAVGPTNITGLGIANGGTVPGVVSDRGEYNFTTSINFFVKTKATKELYDEDHSKNGYATVVVTVKPAEHYTGTGIKNMTAIVDPDGDAIQMATDYNVVNGDTIYLPINYGFQKTDLIDLKLQLDPGASAQITSQNNPQTDPVTITGAGTFHDIQTNGKGFTITVTAENGNTAVYRINLIAASKDDANLNRFQIGGDDGQSLAASFDRQNVEDGQFEMTIKVPFGTLKQQAGNSAYAGVISGKSESEVVIDKYTYADTGATVDSATADFSALNPGNIFATHIYSNFGNAQRGVDWNGAHIGVKFGAGKKVSLVLYKEGETPAVISDEASVSGTTNGKTVTINFTSTATVLGSIDITPYNGDSTPGRNFNAENIFNGTTGWDKFNSVDEDYVLSVDAAGNQFCIIDTGLVYSEAENPYTVAYTNDWDFGKQAVYALISNGATAQYLKTDDTWGDIANSVTEFGEIWNNHARPFPGTKGVIYVRVKHGESYKNYRIKLEEEAARTGNEIIDKSIIADDAVIGECDEFEGAPVSGSNLFKVTVPYEWTDTDAYIYEGLELDPGAVAYIETASGYVPVTKGNGALSDEVITEQTGVEELGITAVNDIVNNGRKPVNTLTEKIYVISEAKAVDLYASLQKDSHTTSSMTLAQCLALNGIVTGGWTEADTNTHKELSDFARVYNVYYERETANNEAQLLTINSSTPGVTASLNNTTKVVTVRVPNSFNWTAFRDKSENDFTVDFTLSEGASIADNAGVTWASGKTTFFVRDSELCVFDKLTGRTKQITNGDTKHEPQAATLTVSSEDNGKVKNNYSFRLTIAPPSSNANLSKVVVGETEATIGSNGEVTVTLPADSDLAAQDVFITPASAVATVQNEKGEAFDSTVKHDLSEPMKFTITAEDGTKAEYTLTAKVGGSVVDPDKKPSESYTDLDKVYSGLLEKVKAAIDMGLMGSTSTTAFVFAPKADVHRKDVAVIIARADLIASNDTIVDSKQADEALKAMYTDGEDAFDDLSKCNDIQKAAIRYCAEKEIIGGNGKGSFNPDGELKREEMAIILTNWTDITVDKNNTTNDEIADWNNVSNWAKPYVNAVYGKMMNGVGNSNFGPKVTVSREQTASMLVDAFGILYPGYGH